MKQLNNGWQQSLEGGRLPASLMALDGATVRGETGNLQIALAPGAMRSSPTAPSPVAWLLPLADIEMVRLSANIPGRLLWLSPRPPCSVAGALVGDFEGAWWNGTEACVKLGDEVESYLVPSGSASIGTIETLALLVALRWSGRSPQQVQTSVRPDAATPFLTHSRITQTKLQPVLV